MAGMSEFRGFSDREIRTLQQQKQRVVDLEQAASFRPADFSRSRAPPRKISPGKRNDDPRDPAVLPTAAYFVKQAQSPPLADQPDQTRPNTTNADEQGPEKDQTIMEGATTTTATQESVVECDLPDLQMVNQSAVETNLELLQRQQKKLEQENKKKKALLEQTLQERYAKSQMEAKKLQAVKDELARLDSLLNRDVTILRDKIEGADRQYTVARKRYETAEAEFVAAKLALHKASEAKELLSEHLCTIIQQNEVRKAEKLAELLKTLELEGQSDNSAATSLPGHALFQKTPTPGINIWPRERLGSKDDSSNKKDIVDDAGVTHDSELEGRGPQDSSEPSQSDESTPKTTENSEHDKNTPLILF